MKIKFKGFIQIELFISVGLIIIISSISFFSVNHIFQKITFQTRVAQLASDIEFVRSLALAKKETLRIEFFGSFNNYRFEIDNSGFGILGKYIERKFDEFSGFPIYFNIQSVSYIDEDGNLAQGSINFGGSQMNSYGILKFYPDGTPSSGGHIVLYSKQLNKFSSVIIKPVTGRCRIGRVLFNNQ